MRSRDLVPMCLKWQKRMRLSDWIIDIKFAREVPKKGLGHIEYDRLRQRASILVLTPSLWKEPLDIEGTVVHELGHLILPDITPENEDWLEAANDRYTELLIQAWNR
jgi:hypothetical protein